MSTERIKQLHEQASELYLSGDYHGALQAWRDVLGLDPKDEQALGGLRLASQFAEPAAPSFTGGQGDVEHELDLGLRVLDGLGGGSLIHPDAAEGSTDRQAGPAGAVESEREAMLDGWEMPTSSGDDGNFGLEPMPQPASAPSAPVSAAAVSCPVASTISSAMPRSRPTRVSATKLLAILARLAILDEDNAEAALLRSQIEAENASDLDKVERAIIEGVAALEADQLDDAERFFREALTLAPDHREVQHYLEKVEERRGGGAEELLTPVGREAAPAEDAVPRATAVETLLRKAAPAPKQPRPEPATATAQVDPPRSASRPRLALPPTKVLLVAGAGALLLVAVAIGLPRLFGGGARDGQAAAVSKPRPRPARKAPAGASSSANATAPGFTVPANTDDAAKATESALATGHAMMASGDFAAAVIAFNQALTLDPQNVAARTGLEQAGDRYKATKSEREALNTIKLAFRDGEFTSALRLAYRLPSSVSKSYTDALKFAGWYNLAVVALRAGACNEAISHLDEALEVAPKDTEARKLREFASHYVDAVKDRAFLNRVEALAFLPLPAY